MIERKDKRERPHRVPVRRRPATEAVLWPVLVVAVVFSCLVVMVLSSVMSGCGGTSGSANAATSVSTGAQGSRVATHIVVDSTGRSVTVPVSPRRIAVMDPFSAEVALMSGAGLQLIGVPNGVMSQPILEQICPGFSSRVTATSGDTINIETLVQAGCDLAIVKRTMSDAELAKLDKMGIPYIKVGYGSMKQQIAAMRLVGSVCGGKATDKAKSLAAYYEQTIKTVQQHAAKIPAGDRKRIYHSINSMAMTDGAGSLGQDWITCVGFIDVSASESPTNGTDYNATLEQVYAWNPDYIVCNVADTAIYTPTDARWTGLAAVSQKRIYNIPIGATRWGQRGDVETYLAMLWLGCTIYPTYYSDINLKQTVIDYYRDYLGVTVDDALYAKMLSGQGMWGVGSGSGSGSGSGTGSGSGSGSGGGKS